MKIYKVKVLEGENVVNGWLEEMSKVKSFEVVSISVNTGAGWWFNILYLIDNKK